MSKVVVLVRDYNSNDAPTAYLAEREEAERFELAVEEDLDLMLHVTILEDVHDKLPELPEPAPVV